MVTHVLAAASESNTGWVIGYVIAIIFLAEKGSPGLHMLRRIAGLVPGETFSGDEKLPPNFTETTKTHD